MHPRFRQLVALIALTVGIAGCEWNPLEPEDPALKVRRSVASAAPSVLAAQATSYAEIVVSWQDNSSNESGFEVQRSTTGANGAFTAYVTIGPNVKSTQDWGVLGAKEYCYKVRNFVTKGRNTTYSTLSNVACATTPAPPPPPPPPLGPAAPTGVNATPRSSIHVDLVWAAQTSAQTGFRVERSNVATGPWSLLKTLGGDYRSMLDVVSSEQTLCYRVTAFNTVGSSIPSAVACTSAPAAPTNLDAKTIDPTTVELTWSDNSTVEQGYEIRRSADFGVTTVLAIVPTNAVSYRDGGLTTGSQYKYTIFAINNGGYSSASNTVTITPRASTSVPVPLDSIQARPSGSYSTFIAFSTAAADAEYYRLERSPDGISGWQNVGNSFSAEGTYDGPVSVEQLICYRAFAVNSIGESPASPVDCTAVPAAPSGLVWVETDGTYKEVRWTDNSNVEDGYLVQITTHVCCNDDGESWVVEVVHRLPPNTTSFRFSVSETFYGVAAARDGGSTYWVTRN